MERGFRTMKVWREKDDRKEKNDSGKEDGRMKGQIKHKQEEEQSLVRRQVWEGYHQQSRESVSNANGWLQKDYFFCHGILH